MNPRPTTDLTRRSFLSGAAAAVTPARPGFGEAAANRPNIVIFMPDQLRAESIACYGHSLVQTPNIDRLAATGVRFTHCQTAYPVCTAARCSMMTGWPPHVRGHRSVYYLLRPEEPNLFRYLKQNDYDVFWYGKNDLLTHECFDDSVSEWNSHAEGFEWDAKDNPWPADHALYYSFLFKEGRDRHDYPDYARVKAAIQVLERRSSRRFCIFLPLFFPHPPYAGPRGFHNLYDPDRIPALRPANLKGKPQVYAAIRESRRLDKLSDREFRRINAVYLGMISYTDWLLGLLLEALEQTGHAADTAVILCSDHGDWAGDYGLVEKWSSAMDDTLLRVPLIIRAPGGAEGRVVGEMVELHDVMATCLDMAGITPEHTHFARSLLPHVRGAPEDPQRAAFSEGGYNSNEPQCFEPLELFEPSHIYYPKILLENQRPELISRTTTIRTRQYKLILRPDGESELYDLRRDRREINNVFNSPEHARQRELLRGRMLDWYIRTSDAAPKERDSRSMPAPRRAGAMMR